MYYKPIVKKACDRNTLTVPINKAGNSIPNSPKGDMSDTVHRKINIISM